jgi:DNA-binding response OmpR family regulator
MEAGLRLLVASDDAAVRRFLVAALSDGDWMLATSGWRRAAADLAVIAPDLLVGDCRSGQFGTLHEIRGATAVPLIALVSSTGAGAAFANGADDSVTWPLNPEELGLRVRALLRRVVHPPSGFAALQGPGRLVLWPRAHEARIDDVEVNLTPKEFELLQLMLERRGEALSADELSVSLWGHETLGTRNFVEAHVSRLRAKLRVAGAAEVITTVRGVGYKIRQP